MKTDPKYGYYPWWPEDGDAWLHPEDVELGRSLIPSYRIFRRDGNEGPFGWLHYGEVRLRVKPTLWKEVSPEGFEIGDWVEVLSRGLQNTPRTAQIREMLWDPTARGLRYEVSEHGQPIPNQYASEDLRHLEPPQERTEVKLPAPEDFGTDDIPLA